MIALKPTKTENLGKFKSYCTLFNLYKANTIIVVKDNRLEMHLFNWRRLLFNEAYPSV